MTYRTGFDVTARIAASRRRPSRTLPPLSITATALLPTTNPRLAIAPSSCCVITSMPPMVAYKQGTIARTEGANVLVFKLFERQGHTRARGIQTRRLSVANACHSRGRTRGYHGRSRADLEGGRRHLCRCPAARAAPGQLAARNDLAGKA